MDGGCYCCDEPIFFDRTWHCSHVVAASLGGTDTVDNLRPCCASCNLSMGDTNLLVYKNNLHKPVIHNTTGSKDISHKSPVKNSKNVCKTVIRSGKNKGTICGRTNCPYH
jgi:HNH endonuclease